MRRNLAQCGMRATGRMLGKYGMRAGAICNAARRAGKRKNSSETCREFPEEIQLA